MPLQKLTLKPGVNREGTNYSNEDGFYYSDKVRFRSGYAEKIGGWQNINYANTYYGIARSLWAWVSLTSENLIGLGTTQKFYITYGNSYYDITPIANTAALATPYFTTTAGSLAVTVTATNHSTTVGSFVTFTKAYTTLSADINSASTSITVPSTTGFPASGTIQIDNEQITYTSITGPVSGIYTLVVSQRGANSTTAAPHLSGATVISREAITVGGVSLMGQFRVIKVTDANNYVITAASTASTGTTGGSGTYAIYQLAAGSGSYTSSSGWGSMPWGTLGWGSGIVSTTTIPLRLWSQSNYDQDLIFAPRYGAIYWWTKNTSAFPRAVTLNTQANSINKTRNVSSTWTIGGSSIVVASTDGINTGAVVTGTGIPAGTYVSPDWNFSTTIPLLSAPSTPAVLGGTGAGSLSFSYAGKHVPNKTLLITTTSQNAFTIAFGATPYDPTNFDTTFDPLLVRWSDQDNPNEWVPETTNQSGEQRLSNGSVIVAATNTRQEILIWTDTAIYSMQYLGPPYVFGINLLMDNLSIASQNAAITVNNVTYWMGVDRFYQYSGRVETLPCTLRQFVYSDINRNQLSQICCGTNEGFNEVWWFYPSANSLINNRYVIYNHLENTWVYGTINRSAWLDTQLEQNPLGAFSTEATFLPNAITASQTSILVNDLSSFPSSGTVTIDNEQITYANANYDTNYLEGCVRGANNTTAASHIAYTPVSFKTPNQLMFHESGWDDASNSTAVPFEAYIESSDFDIGDGMNFAYVWRIIPDLTFSGSSPTSSPKCNLTVKVRQNSGSAYTVGSTDATTVVRTSTYLVEQYTGQVYTRVRGRQMAFRMDTKVADGLGIFWQMGMMRIDVKPDGRR